MEKRLSRKLSKGLKELDKKKELIEQIKYECAKVAEEHGDLEIASVIRNINIVTKAE